MPVKNIRNILCVYSADNVLKHSIFRVSQIYKQVYFYSEITQVVSTLLRFCKAHFDGLQPTVYWNYYCIGIRILRRLYVYDNLQIKFKIICKYKTLENCVWSFKTNITILNFTVVTSPMRFALFHQFIFLNGDKNSHAF